MSSTSQQTEHRRFGGVVPEIAARAHLRAHRRADRGRLTEAKLGHRRLDAAPRPADRG
jgi:tRNA A37 threonylcarbamoyltransferase TsaD